MMVAFGNTHIAQPVGSFSEVVQTRIDDLGDILAEILSMNQTDQDGCNQENYWDIQKKSSCDVCAFSQPNDSSNLPLLATER